MEIELSIHLDVAEEEGLRKFVWWAEADAVPGFSAAADHLPSLLEQAQEALNEILGEEVVIASRIIRDETSTSGDADNDGQHRSQITQVQRSLVPA